MATQRSARAVLVSIVVSVGLVLGIATGASAEPAGCQLIKKLPTMIKKRGVYCLAKSLRVRLEDGSAIEVVGDDIVVDLSEKTIVNRSTFNTARGVSAEGRSNVVVRNGTIEGFAQGVVLQGGGLGNLVEDLRVINSAEVGIAVLQGGVGATVRRSQVLGSRGIGIMVAGPGARVLDCDVADVARGSGDVFGVWMSTAPGGLVRDTRIHNVSSGDESTGIHIEDSLGVMVRGNDVANTGTNGIAFTSGGDGMYMDNEVFGATNAFVGGTAAGDTNHEP